MKKVLIPLMLIIACNSKKDKDMKEEKSYQTIGVIERIDPALDSIIDADAKAEIIAEGFEWSEGPLWVETEKILLFSDVPTNTIYKWTEAKGKEVYLTPSGYTDSVASKSKEPGSNGLTLDSEGRLVLCQHGDRRMARMDAPLNAPAAKFITIADKYDGKRVSSPNDAVYNSLGELYFTDPPYGLPMQNDNDPTKETSFNAVYKVSDDGRVWVVTDSLSRPNGLAFFPDGRLLVANCDPNKPDWYLIDTGPDDTLIHPKLFFSVAGYDKKLKGLPDGLKIDSKGNVFATGPGGLYILNKDGKLLGKLKLDNAASNCALSPDEKTLYITNDMYVLRFKMR
jgi:gluconolactonase